MDIRIEMNEQLKYSILVFTPIRELSSHKALTKRALIPYMLKIQL
jgi:hypothetical protein